MLVTGPHAPFAHGRRSSTALALALIVAQGGVAAHFALVRHAYYPEHDDLVELPGAQGAEDRLRDGREPGLYPPDGATGTSEHGHDHCVLSGHKGDGVRPPPAHLEQIAQVQAYSCDGCVERAPASVTLFLVAPKQSPPLG